MTESCDGNGYCLHQTCGCSCYDEDTDIDHDVCTCGHRDHKCGGYCPLSVTNCKHNCQLVECRLCKTYQPNHISLIHNGYCGNCASIMGCHTVSDIIEKCSICLETKQMVILKCGHHLCMHCQYKIGIDPKNNWLCPFCGKYNGW